ncbi:inaD-like protein isoform X1, partial [Lates japonicus]
LSSMPPDACSEFSFSKKGQLIMSAVDPAGSSAPPALSASSSVLTNGSSLPVHQTPPPSDLLQKWILAAAKGRQTELVSLTRPLSGGLGFSVVGLNPAGSSSQGVFVKHIQPGGIAHRDGRLQERDQILVINGSPLETGISQQQALTLLQQPGETVELVVARERPPNATSPATPINTVVKLDPVIEDDAELQKSSKLLPVHTLRLGVELDSFDGHHYISSVVPGGPVDKHGVLRPEDELLEVNDVQLYGKSRREVVSFLKEVPPPFTLVCCRHPTSDLEPEPESEPESEPEPVLRPGRGPARPRDLQPSVEEIELKLSSMLGGQTVLRDDSGEQQQAVRQEQVSPVEEVQKEEKIQHRHEEEEDEEQDEDEDVDEDEEELALWSPDVQVLELQKERDKGLGFSILDYQDPLDPGRCVMVIRSLVPGGSAERHGGLLPGDQLVSVNQTQLDLLTLAQAVEVLKSAPHGTVRLGIRKPLVVEGPERRSEDSSQVSLNSTHLSVPKGFGDGSILPEDLRQGEEEEEEPELILDGGLV